MRDRDRLETLGGWIEILDRGREPGEMMPEVVAVRESSS
jgi:hypothetical protein